MTSTLAVFLSWSRKVVPTVLASCVSFTTSIEEATSSRRSAVRLAVTTISLAEEAWATLAGWA